MTVYHPFAHAREAHEHVGDPHTTVPDVTIPHTIGERPTVLVPVSGVDEVSRMALSAAVTMTSQPVAIRVCHPHESTTEFTRQWQSRYPHTRLILIEDTDDSVGLSLARYVRTHFPHRHTFVVLATIEPATAWHRLLPTHRADGVTHALRKHSNANVCQLVFHVDPAHLDPALA
ncbi:hypothetical protein [Rhodococcus sp. JVH1]|uniref:hypothetical protein n=1 Tax=Rhodococcus sp. JVH1 TaxID=745408 RepID=UPI000271EEA8|nr:hypothetical protein [Rhodococcus sp. JVH1]EJJ01715.1 hypothetical protein JVH1_0744 [Rhodococcus sp. JVH1]